MRAGVIGLGDMGSGIAKNLIANGFEVVGLDLDEGRMTAFREMGGKAANSASEVGANAEAVFVMVMNGDEVKEVIFGSNGKAGLVETMAPGSVIILSATIHASEARQVAERL